GQLRIPQYAQRDTVDVVQMARHEHGLRAALAGTRTGHELRVVASGGPRGGFRRHGLARHVRWTPRRARPLNERRPAPARCRGAPQNRSGPLPAGRQGQTLTFWRRETWLRRSLEGLKIGT